MVKFIKYLACLNKDSSLTNKRMHLWYKKQDKKQTE